MIMAQSTNLYPLAEEGRWSSTKMGRVVNWQEKAKAPTQRALKMLGLQ